jgi:serine/threonine-protein kinase
LDTAHWLQLSSYLDELLDLHVDARNERLARIQDDDPQCAATLAAMLARLTGLDRQDFLGTPAPLLVAGIAGQTVGPYTLERELGHGGMASVWLARRTDGRYDGCVAIKFLNLGMMTTSGAARFAREGSILARLTHPNIARLVDAGVASNGQPYLVLDYIDGEPIDRYCERAALSIRERLLLFLDVLAAVTHAHQRLILHRDIKPGNILVTRAGEVKLLDFGIAKLIDAAHVPAAPTELTRLAGRPFTLAYAAPEQVQGGEVTTATDVYSLGVMLYGLLGGVHPTQRANTTPLEQLRALVETEPPLLSQRLAHEHKGSSAHRPLVRELRGELDSILAQALRKPPQERYANASALADELQRYLSHLPVLARPDTRSYRLAKFMRRHRWGVAATAALLLTLAGGLGAELLQARETRLQQAKAEGLIEFMLGELRQKLQPVGRLDVLDVVGAKALAYYDAQPAERLDADSLGRRARALHLIGEIAELRGNLADAATIFARAAADTQLLMRHRPDSGRQIFDHAQSTYWVGYLAWRRGSGREAEQAFGTYLQLAQRLRQLDVTNVEWQLEEGFAEQNLGVVLFNRGDTRSALQRLLRAQACFQLILPSRPELLGTLISNRGWVAKAREQLGQVQGAIDELQLQLALHRKGRAGDRRTQQAVAVANSELARLLLSRGDALLARQAALTAAASLTELHAADPDNLFWRQELAWALLRMADAQLALRDYAGAAANLQGARTSIEEVLARNLPSAKHWNYLLGFALSLEANLALHAKHAVAESALEQWLAAFRRHPAEAAQRLIVARASLALGDLYARRGDRVLSQSQWQHGAGVLASPSAATDPLQMTILAQLQLRLGKEASARALATRIAATHFQHPVYADLARRLGTQTLPSNES